MEKELILCVYALGCVSASARVVYVCVRECVGAQARVRAHVRACSITHSACNAHEPYCLLRNLEKQMYLAAAGNQTPGPLTYSLFTVLLFT